MASAAKEQPTQHHPHTTKANARFSSSLQHACDSAFWVRKCLNWQDRKLGMRSSEESRHSSLMTDSSTRTNSVRGAENTTASDETANPYLRLISELLHEVRDLRADLRALTGAVLNREQAAGYLGLSVRNLHELVKRGLVKRVTLSTGRYGFRREELDRYLEENEHAILDDPRQWYENNVES
jgi:Helix-turn-helix domain